MEARASPVERLFGRHPVSVDWLVTGVVTLAALGQHLGRAQQDAAVAWPTGLGIPLVLAGGVPVAWRRRSPLGVLAVTELVVLAQLLRTATAPTAAGARSTDPAGTQAERAIAVG